MGKYIKNSNWTKEISDKVISECRNICSYHGKKYYLASLFFNKKNRIATWIVYAFVRIPDEMVDNEKDLSKSKLLLSEWKEKWKQIYSTDLNNTSEDLFSYKYYEILNAVKIVFKNYNIPFEYSLDFIKSMEMDLVKNRYLTYKELEDYMYGSAVVVGYFMTYIIGFKHNALDYAKSLAEAMQMTNFLRDVSEDYFLRNRIYIPKQDMDKYQISETDIQNQNLNNNFKNLIKFEIEKTKKLYIYAYDGIKFLNKNGQFAVYLSGKLYEKILDKIVTNNYNIFKKRISVTTIEKFVILLKVICNIKKIKR